MCFLLTSTVQYVLFSCKLFRLFVADIKQLDKHVQQKRTCQYRNQQQQYLFSVEGDVLEEILQKRHGNAKQNYRPHHAVHHLFPPSVKGFTSVKQRKQSAESVTDGDKRAKLLVVGDYARHCDRLQQIQRRRGDDKCQRGRQTPL